MMIDFGLVERSVPLNKKAGLCARFRNFLSFPNVPNLAVYVRNLYVFNNFHRPTPCSSFFLSGNWFCDKGVNTPFSSMPFLV